MTSLQDLAPSDEMNLSNISNDELPELEALLADLKRERDRDRLALYHPYTKQAEFHAAGKEHSDRLFMAGNQLGKTVAGGAEWAMHLTGRYPDWWRGKRFDEPVKMWAAGVTAESTRDNPQRILVGPPPMERDWGTGMIPGDCIVDTTRARGTPDLLDNIVVKHATGAKASSGSKATSRAVRSGRGLHCMAAGSTRNPRWTSTQRGVHGRRRWGYSRS